MNIREKVRKIFPSYRIGKIILDELQEQIKGVNDNIDDVRKQINEFELKNEYMFWLSQKRDGESMAETKERVFLDMPKATGTLRNIQIAENYILKKIKKVCDENNLKLILAGGTLLGAVRHHGFIPWDDDIDLYMFSDDAKKLIKLLSNDSLLFANYHYTVEGTTMIKVKFREAESIFVDIFSVDYLNCPKQMSIEDTWNATDAVSHKLADITRKILENNNLHPSPIHPTAYPQIDDIVENEYNSLISKLDFYGKGEYICHSIHDAWYFRGATGMFKAVDCLPLIEDKIEFEGEKYCVFKNYKERLSFQYGDIWNLPRNIQQCHEEEVEVGLTESLNILTNKHIIE